MMTLEFSRLLEEFWSCARFTDAFLLGHRGSTVMNLYPYLHFPGIGMRDARYTPNGLGDRERSRLLPDGIG